MMATAYLQNTIVRPTTPHLGLVKVRLLPLHSPAPLWARFTPPHDAVEGADNFKVASPSTTPYPDLKAQKAFEKGLLEKTAKQTTDIILYDNRIVLYKMESDIMMYVVGGLDENEIMLYNVILALRDSLHLLFKYVQYIASPEAFERTR
jgi:hypothetical protein